MASQSSLVPSVFDCLAMLLVRFILPNVIGSRAVFSMARGPQPEGKLRPACGGLLTAELYNTQQLVPSSERFSLNI